MSEVIVGEIGEDGSPCVDIFLYGVYEDHPGLRLRGVVDTGFTGFLQINFLEACKIKLPLEGIGSSQLADGSVVRLIQAIGYVSLTDDPEATPVVGIVDLSEESEKVLIGMDFLRAFKKGLKVYSDRVILVPDPPSE